MGIAKDGGMGGASTNDAYHGGGGASWDQIQNGMELIGHLIAL